MTPVPEVLPTSAPPAPVSVPPEPPGEPCLLLKLGEVVLKGRNREQFERRLQDNIRSAVRRAGGEVNLSRREGVFVLRVPGADRVRVDALAERVRDVIGLVWVHRAWRVAKDPEAVATAAAALAAGRQGSFAIRARRRDKRFPMTSAELAVLLGSRVQEAHALPVDLTRPAFSIFVEVDRDEVFVFTDGLAGHGGLPVGMSGRGLVLMSGGIDSPVAGYRMMRRGLRCDFLHFSGMPFTGPASIYKAYGLVRELSRFQRDPRLFVVPFGKAQQRLKATGADRLLIVAQRRLMLKTAAALAGRLRAGVLVTGDSLGQVSSQTLANIVALDDAVSMPILRPLIGWDKSEIMAEARRLRTLAISELPDEDCCTLLAPRRVETRAKIEDLHRVERRLGAGDLVDELVAAVQEYSLTSGDTPRTPG